MAAPFVPSHVSLELRVRNEWDRILPWRVKDPPTLTSEWKGNTQGEMSSSATK